MAKNDKPDEGSGAGPDLDEQYQSAPAVPIEQLPADVDPRTNQPVSDFLPRAAKDSDEQKAYDLLARNVTTATGTGMLLASHNMMEAQAAEAENEERAAEHLKTVRAQTRELLKGPTALLDPRSYRAQMQAEVSAEAALNRKSTIRVGGVFNVAGRWVNAFGEEVDAPSDDE